MRHVPEIKLIRTDTTLDLSQKAEKVWLAVVALPGRCLGQQSFGHGFGPFWNHLLDFGAEKGAVVQTGPTGRKKIKERIEMRGLNLMRSMQQGISTHYNTRFGI